MIKLVRTNAENQDFKSLVKSLDLDLAERDGDEHAFYDQFNKISQIKYVIVLYKNEKPIACGAIKEYKTDSAEVKRMYTLPEERNKGLATTVLTELESWASELNFKRCILETGKKQKEAIKLYERNGYQLTANYGQYENIENSLCFEKNLIK